MLLSPSRRARSIILAGVIALACGGCRKDEAAPTPTPTPQKPAVKHVIVVGAGITGIAAALEAAEAGAKVTLVDKWSLMGGHAIVSHGGVFVVDSPLQRSKNIQDSPDLAFADFTAWGEDVNDRWVRRYVDHSRTDVHDWLIAHGVTFSDLMHVPGNAVPRFHMPKDRGYGLILPLVRRVLDTPNIEFVANVEVTELIKEGGAVVGARGFNRRTDAKWETRADAVILATGGFQSNLEMVRKHWPQGMRMPERILRGSGVNSLGSGHELARKAGADLVNLERMWNYVTGLPDPTQTDGEHGLSVWNHSGIWVNTQGKRFTNDDWFSNGMKNAFRAVLEQSPATYWLIFDEAGKSTFVVSGSGWGDPKYIDEKIFRNPAVTKTAATLAELATATGLPPKVLVETVGRYNKLVDQGEDTDFGRFGGGKTTAMPRQVFNIDKGRAVPPKLQRGPFYALQMFVLARKNLGGVRIDLEARVLDERGTPIRGLYAAGELTGFAGINGRAGLEGTFLGPCVLTGRVAAQSALERPLLPPPAKELAAVPLPVPVASPPVIDKAVLAEQLTLCASCHNMSALVAAPRRGYEHFSGVHTRVLATGLSCATCHSELIPYDVNKHRLDKKNQLGVCGTCHGK